MDHLFCGSAIGAVSAAGDVVVPFFVRRAVERRSCRTILFGVHETDPCVTGSDAGYPSLVQSELERRRLRDEAEGVGPEAHHARLRRLFGLVEEASYDEEGRLVLPPMMRRRGAIEDLALFVGTGGNFELWNPHLARESGCEELRELAQYRLERVAA